MVTFRLTLLAGCFAAGVLCAGEVVFSLETLTYEQVSTTAIAPTSPQAVNVVVDQQGPSLSIRLNGEPKTAAKVVIQLPNPLRTTGELSFQASTDNLQTGDEPTLYLQLGDGRQLPALRAQGGRATEVGRLSFGESGPVTVTAIGMLVMLDAQGAGVLQVSELSLAIDGNLLDDQAVKEALSSPPAVRAGVAGPAHRPLVFTVNDQPLNRIGLAGSQTAPSGTVSPGWRRVSLNLGGAGTEEGASLRPYADYLDTPGLEAKLEQVNGASGWIILELVIAGPPAWYDGQAMHVSAEWRTYCETSIRQVLARLAQLPQREQVIGISLSIGEGASGQPWPLTMSRLTEDAFRAWLTDRYANPDAMRAAWKEPGLDLGKPIWQPVDAGAGGDVFDFYHPLAGRRARDSEAFVEETWLSFVLGLAADIKEKTGGRLLVGLAGGPACWANPAPGHRSRWLRESLMAVLDSAHVDWLDIPAYLPQPMLLAQAAAKRQKLLMVRYDSEVEAVEERRQVVAATLLNGGVLELGAVAGEWPADLQQMLVVAERIAILDRLQVPELAFGVGSAVYDCLAPAAAERALLAMSRESWSRAGLPYQIDLVDDLRPELHNVVVYHQALKAEPEWVSRAQEARSGGRVQAFVWGTGIVSPDRISPSTMGELAGLDLRWRPRTNRFFLSPRPEMRSAMGIEQIMGYLGWLSASGADADLTHHTQGPLFVVNDPAATIMADYGDGGEPAMAWRQFDDWTAFYSGSPYLNPEVLQALARQAGAHVFLSGNDLSVFSGRFMALYTSAGGVREVKLPRAESLYEVWREQEIDPANMHRLELQAGQSYLFLRGTWDEWINARR